MPHNQVGNAHWGRPSRNRTYSSGPCNNRSWSYETSLRSNAPAIVWLVFDILRIRGVDTQSVTNRETRLKKLHVSVVATEIGVKREYELECEQAGVVRLAEVLREILV